MSGSSWNAELKCIDGYRSGLWTPAVNPNIDWSLGSHLRPASGDVDIQFNRAMDAKTEVSIYSYNELGPIRGFQSLRKNARTLYAVLDREIEGWDLNAGIGLALTDEADRWTVKFIVGYSFLRRSAASRPHVAFGSAAISERHQGRL